MGKGQMFNMIRDLQGIPRSNIQGVSEVFNKINRTIAQAGGTKSLTGLLQAASLINEETEAGDTRVPVDLGNLRHSWFIVTSSGNIQAGGGVTRTTEGGIGAFVGPESTRLASEHASVLSEMKAKANALSRQYIGPFVILGYSAHYAVYVHENLEVKHWKREKSGPRWFQRAVYKHRDKIVSLIANNIKTP